MQRVLSILLAALLIAGLVACAQIDPIPEKVFDPGQDSGSADFGLLLAFGDAWAAGFQNNGLSESRQIRSVAAQVARQMGKLPLSRGTTTPEVNDFVIPGFSDPGTPGTVWLVSLSPPTLEPIPVPGVPVNTLYPVPYNNLGIPGATLRDLIVTVTLPANPSFDLVLRGQGAALIQAVALEPSFVVLWAGTWDVLQAVVLGLPPTSKSAFDSDYRTIVQTLMNPPVEAQIAAANVVDVLELPFVTTVPPIVVDSTGTPVMIGGQLVPLIGPDGPLSLTDKVTLTAIPLLKQGIGIPVPIGTGAPLPAQVVLNAVEQDEIRQAVVDYNDVIATVAADKQFPVIDANAWLTGAGEGIVVGGVDFTTDFITGGLISLDGIHPTDLGQALLANRSIETINAWYGSSIPIMNLTTVTAEN